MSDLDDFITINITCDQAAALGAALMLCEELGIMQQFLPEFMRESIGDFAATMEMEIQRQKTGINNQNREMK